MLHTICKLGEHFTLREIQSTLEAGGSRMAMTTVYRNLPELERAGIVQRATAVEEAGNRAATWEHVWGRPHHDHLVCRACGRKVEFVYEALEVLQQEVARQHGFRLLSHSLELVGLCAACQEAASPASP